MSKIELMPCPFCGGENISEEMSMDNEPYSICTDCGASVDNGPDAWNTRADTSSDAAAMACRWLEAKESLATKDAEIARLNGMLEWRTIETAPKDGSDVLTWDGNDRCVLFFSQHGHGWTAGNPKVKYQPTHWMHLPLSPIPDPAGGMPLEVR